MPAWKALLAVVIVGSLVAFGVFLLFPGMRPPVVKEWFFNAQGFKLAKTPNEAVDLFREAIRKRNYEAAARYCGGEYVEELRKGTKGATRLADAADDLMHNVEDVANINSPKGKFTIRLLEPFPKDFKVIKINHAEGQDIATAEIQFDPVATQDVYFNAPWRLDSRILLSLVPVDGNDIPLVLLGYKWTVPLRNEGEKEKAWKIHFAVTTRLRDSVTYLKDNYGNYARALDNIKYAIKHEAATKADFENQLKKELEEAK
jgi:hypothetical protein